MSQYDSTNMRVSNLCLGFIFDYDLQTWEIAEEFVYDWGNGNYTKEFKISNGNEEKLISIGGDDDRDIAIWEKMDLQTIDRNLAAIIIKNSQAPSELSLNEIIYFKKTEALGFCSNMRTSKGEKLIRWHYTNDTSKKQLNIDRWDEGRFETSMGNKVDEYEISNILPREKQTKTQANDQEKNKKRSTNFYWILLFILALIILGISRCGN